MLAGIKYVQQLRTKLRSTVKQDSAESSKVSAILTTK